MNSAHMRRNSIWMIQLAALKLGKLFNNYFSERNKKLELNYILDLYYARVIYIYIYIFA
jgi:hypothetical protein